MPPLGDPSGSSTPVRKNQVAKKSTAKKPRNLAPPPRPDPTPPPVIEIITLDSDEDEEDVKSTAAEMKIEAGTPQSEPSEVGESPMKTEESPVKQELSDSDSENEEEQLVKVRPEPVALKNDPDEPRTPLDTRRSRSIQSDSSPPPSVQENENAEDQSSPDGPVVLNDFEDDQSEAQRTLEEAFAERRKIQEARWRCQQQGIGLDGHTPSRRDFNRKVPNLVVSFRKVEFKKRGHPARATPLKAVAGTQYRMGSSVFDTPGQPMPLQTPPQVPLTERRKMQENRRRLLKLQEKIRGRRQQQSENNCQSEAETSGSQESQEAVLPVPDEDQMPPAPDEAIQDQAVEIEDPGAAEEANLPQQMDVEDQDDECWNWEEVPMVAVSDESENNRYCPVEVIESQTQSTAQNPLKELREAREARWRQSQQGSSAASTISTTLTTPVVEAPQVPIQSESHITALREEALRQDELSEHRRMQENRWRQQVQDGVRAQPGPSRKRKKPSPDARANQEIQWFQRNNDPLIPENNFAAVAGSVAQNIRRSNRDVTFSARGSRVLQNGVERFISGMLSDANAIAGSTGRKTIKGKDVKLALRLARERRN